MPESCTIAMLGPRICQRQQVLLQALDPKVAVIAWRTQERLHRRYWALTQKSKRTGKIVAALARELVGFVWAIGRETEQRTQPRKKAA